MEPITPVSLRSCGTKLYVHMGYLNKVKHGQMDNIIYKLLLQKTHAQLTNAQVWTRIVYSEASFTGANKSAFGVFTILLAIIEFRRAALVYI